MALKRHTGKGVFGITALAKVMSGNMDDELTIAVGRPAYNPATHTLYLPGIPGDDVEPDTLRLLRAYLAHESAERGMSTWDPTDPRWFNPTTRQMTKPGLKALVNGINDARIDREIGEKYPGAGLNIRWAVQRDIDELLRKNKEEPVRPSVNLFGVLGRYIGEGLLTVDDLYREFPQLDKHLKKVDGLLRTLDTSSEPRIIDQAIALYNALKKPEAPPQPEPPKAPAQEPQPKADATPDKQEQREDDEPGDEPEEDFDDQAAPDADSETDDDGSDQEQESSQGDSDPQEKAEGNNAQSPEADQKGDSQGQGGDEAENGRQGDGEAGDAGQASDETGGDSEGNPDGTNPGAGQDGDGEGAEGGTAPDEDPTHEPTETDGEAGESDFADDETFRDDGKAGAEGDEPGEKPEEAIDEEDSDGTKNGGQDFDDEDGLDEHQEQGNDANDDGQGNGGEGASGDDSGAGDVGNGGEATDGANGPATAGQGTGEEGGQTPDESPEGIFEGEGDIDDEAESDHDTAQSMLKDIVEQMFGDEPGEYGVGTPKYTFDPSNDVVKDVDHRNGIPLPKSEYGAHAQVMETKLRQALTMPAPRMLRGKDKGEVDERVLSRVAMGKTDVFKRRVVTESDSVAVSLSWDESGSMSHSRIETVQKLAYIFNAALGRLGIPTEMLGWTTSKNAVNNEDVYRQSTVRHRVYKGFNDIYTDDKVLRRLGQVKVGDLTPTAEGLRFALERLAHRTERRKVLFFLTDGDPYMRTNGDYGQAHNEFILTLLDKAARAGIEVVGVGISADLDKLFAPGTWIRVDDVKDLRSRVGETLVRVLRDGKRRLLAGR